MIWHCPTIFPRFHCDDFPILGYHFPSCSILPTFLDWWSPFLLFSCDNLNANMMKRGALTVQAQIYTDMQTCCWFWCLVLLHWLTRNVEDRPSCFHAWCFKNRSHLKWQLLQILSRENAFTSQVGTRPSKACYILLWYLTSATVLIAILARRYFIMVNFVIWFHWIESLIKASKLLYAARDLMFHNWPERYGVENCFIWWWIHWMINGLLFPSPLIHISEFCVEFPDGSFKEYSANVIAEKLSLPSLTTSGVYTFNSMK